MTTRFLTNIGVTIELTRDRTTIATKNSLEIIPSSRPTDAATNEADIFGIVSNPPQKLFILSYPISLKEKYPEVTFRIEAPTMVANTNQMFFKSVNTLMSVVIPNVRKNIGIKKPYPIAFKFLFNSSSCSSFVRASETATPVINAPMIGWSPISSPASIETSIMNNTKCIFLMWRCAHL